MKRIGRWMAAHPVRPALAALALIALFGFAPAFSAKPRGDRDWVEHLARTPHVTRAEHGFTVAPVRDWRYGPEGPISKAYEGEAAFEFTALRNVWFMLEPQPGSAIAAHTLLLFEFDDDRLIGVTIEARREADEDYSPWDGLWNAFELAYIWAEPRDLLTRRAVFLDHEVFVYPLRMTYAQKVTLLSRLADTTAELETQPRFYNTLFSNCTNELAKRADLSWDSAFILTGLSDDHLYKVGVIPGAAFEEAQALGDVTALLHQLNPIDDSRVFDAALLAELRARWNME